MGVLDGKTAVVAGGTSGIGARIAELFVEEGAQVAIASPFAEEGEALAATLGAGACFIAADVAEEVQVTALIEAAVARFGRLDCMVNNAGIAGRFSGVAGLDMNISPATRQAKNHATGVLSRNEPIEASIGFPRPACVLASV